MKKLYNENIRKNIKDMTLIYRLKEYNFKVIGTIPILVGDKYMTNGNKILPLYSVYDLSYCKVKEPMFIDKASNLLIPSSNSTFIQHEIWKASIYKYGLFSQYNKDGVCRGQHHQEFLFCP